MRHILTIIDKRGIPNTIWDMPEPWQTSKKMLRDIIKAENARLNPIRKRLASIEKEM
jgi:hypothetical protein